MKAKDSSFNPSDRFRSISKPFALVVALTGAALYDQLCRYLGVAGKGIAVAVSLGAILLIVQVSWTLRRQAWFWATVSFFVFYHAIIIYSVKPVHVQYLVSIFPIVFLDFAAMFSVVWTINKIVRSVP